MKGKTRRNPRFTTSLLLAVTALMCVSSRHHLQAEPEIFNRKHEETANIFMDILFYDKAIFGVAQWEISETAGVKTVKSRNANKAESPTTFIIDRRNRYSSETVIDGSIIITNEAAVFFKSDNTPIIAVNYRWNDGFRFCGSKFKVYEYACGPGLKKGYCKLKEVTRDLFPPIDHTHFLNDDPASKNLQYKLRSPLSEIMFIEYKIPRSGTTIVATPAVTGIALGCRDDCRKVAEVLTMYKSINIHWNGGANQFEIREKEKGAMTVYGQD